jgi:cell division protease FtsH
MSDTLGAVNYDGGRGTKFIDTPFLQERGNHSEDTAQKIDGEVKRLISGAHDHARQILHDRNDVLDELSRRLLDREVIEGAELRELLGPVPPKDPEGTIPPALPPEGPAPADRSQ